MKKCLLFVICFSGLLSLSLSPKKVMADTSHSKVSGTLLDPTLSSDKNNTSTAPKKGKEFPKTGEKAYFPLRLIGIPIVLFSGTIWYARKKVEDGYE